MIDDSQIYVVVDIEADGPMPGLHSMLSLAAVATTPNREIARFYRKLMPIKGATRQPNTMRWWRTQPEAWQEVNTDPEPASVVMKDFCAWLHALKAEPIFVASPIALDYSFVGWYLYRFVGANPFSNQNNAVRTIDLRSFISGKYGLSFNNSTRPKLPNTLTAGMIAHNHKAIDDAVGYGALLRKVLKTPPDKIQKNEG